MSAKVAVVGYAHTRVLRHADRPLGAQAVETAHAAIADAGLRLDQIDGFVSSSLLPSAGGQSAEDGVSTVSSAWLARHLGAEPRYVAGFDGIGQITGSVGMAVNAVASGAADYVLLHRALHNPAGKYHANPMRQARGPMQWTAPQGFFGPLAMIALPYNEYLQRYGASRESMAAVVVEARKNGARIPWSYWYDRPLDRAGLPRSPVALRPDLPLRLRHPGRRRGHVRLHLRRTRPGLAAITRCTWRVTRSARPTARRLPMHWPLDDIVGVGAQTARRLWESAGVGPAEVDLPQVYDGFSPFVWFWLEVLGICPPGEAHRFVAGRWHRQRPPGCDPRALGWRCARKRADARDTADAGVLPAAGATGR